MKNKNRETLFTNLLRGMYALGGIDGEFVGALCRTIPFVPSRVEGLPTQGVLAVFPREKVAQLERLGNSWDELAAQARADAVDDWDDDDRVHDCFEWMVECEARRDEADAQLDAMLAA